MFASPQPTDEELSRIYDKQYYAKFGFNDATEHALREMKQASFARFLDLVTARLNGDSRRLLDVGSGVGDMLAVARRKAWYAVGLEPNLHGAIIAERVAPGATLTEPIESYRCNEGRFDVVTCLDVIEHLRCPDLALRTVSQCLAPGGIVLISTPDVGSIGATLLHNSWPHYHRDHLWYFNRRTLRRLVEAAGFEVVLQHQSWKTFNLRYVLAILATHSHTGLLHRVAMAVKDSLPHWLLNRLWPSMPEGQLVLATHGKRGSTTSNTDGIS